MQLRTSAMLVGLVLSTAAWADESTLHPANFADCREATYVAQVLETDLTDTTEIALARTEEASEADRVAAIIDSIVQNTVVVGSWLPLVDEPDMTLASTLTPDLSEVTGSIIRADAAMDGSEDR
jgi:hypothetical protein